MFHLEKISHSDWEELWKGSYKTNLVQSWSYGESKKTSEGWNIERILIKKNAKKVALVQVLIKEFFLIWKVIRINRGPIIIYKGKNEERESICRLVIKQIIDNYRTFGLLVIQIVPEINDNNANEKYLRSLGLKKTNLPQYKSGLIKLQQDENKIMMSFNGKWRNCLKKGMQSDIKILRPKLNKDTIAKVLEVYGKSQVEKKFRGLSNTLISSMFSSKEDNFRINIFFAYDNNILNSNEPIGILTSVYHGNTTTYLIAYSDLIGRKPNVNYVMLWKAILKAKSDGCNWFDIGGLNEQTPRGVAHFKKGLNSELYSLIGEWRTINLLPKTGI